MKKASTWGGKREGAGGRRKEPTATITIRVPSKYKPALMVELKRYANQWIASKKIEEIGRVIELVKRETLGD